MKHTIQKHTVKTNDRSAMESMVNINAEKKALDALFLDFTGEMSDVLSKKMQSFVTGWDNPEWTEEEIGMNIIEQVVKGNMVHAANYAMFLWNKQQK